MFLVTINVQRYSGLVFQEYKDECQAQVEVLEMLEKKYESVGPVFDCIVFNDGTNWR